MADGGRRKAQRPLQEPWQEEWAGDGSLWRGLGLLAQKSGGNRAEGGLPSPSAERPRTKNHEDFFGSWRGALFPASF
ncbi:hypothetical protein DXC92_16105 [Clostridiales bacterium TF09-2AC]|nr:hypothetical protein DXC92_16105 [Clostridiales bacterium TF09-2AC]